MATATSVAVTPPRRPRRAPARTAGLTPFDHDRRVLGDLAGEAARLGSRRGRRDRREQEAAPRPGHRHEAEPALLGDGELVGRLLLEELDRDEEVLLAGVGELALDEARHDDDLVLEALRLVDRHELDAVGLDAARAVGVEVAAGLLEEVEVGDEVEQACLRVLAPASRRRSA